jgi:hypothetical protein
LFAKYNFAHAIHQTENPEVGLDILSNRFKDAQKLDTELADYFKERYRFTFLSIGY